MTTILMNNRIETASGARVLDGALWMSRAEYTRIVGESPVDDGVDVNVSQACRRLGRPLVGSEAADVWAIGASARERSAALRSLEAPDFTLSDLEGRPHSLSDYRGTKVFLASWSSW